MASEKSKIPQPPGPKALACLQENIPPEVLSVMPDIMAMETTDLPGYARIRLQLASVPGGYIWVYLEPKQNPQESPEMLICGESTESLSTGFQVTPVVEDDHPDARRLLALSKVLSVIDAHTYKQLYAFVAYAFLLAADSKEVIFDQHVIPIDQELIDDLSALCTRKGFRKKMADLKAEQMSAANVANVNDTGAQDAKNNIREHDA